MTHTDTPQRAAFRRGLASALNFDSRWLQPLQIMLVVAVLSGIAWLYTLNLVEADRVNVMATAERTFASVDQTLKIARTQYLEHAAQFDFKELTAQGLNDTRVIRHISLIDPRGQVKLSTQAPSLQANFSESDYFKVHRASESDALYISDSDLGPDAQAPSLHLSRRITLKNGQFGGVMVAAMDLRYFSQFGPVDPLAGHQKTRRILLNQAIGLSLLLSVFGLVLSWYSLARRKVLLAHKRELLALQALNHRAPGMIYQYQQRADGTAHFVFASEGARDLFRLSPQQLMADAALAFALIHPDDVIGVRKSIEMSARQLSPWQLEFQVCFEDGMVRWISGKALPQQGPYGAIQWDGFMSDITEHKRIEAAAHAANLAKTHFLSSMSHEIRSPLNAILGLAYLLEQAHLPQDAHTMVRQIRASGRILLGLISDILDVSKIEAGQMLIEQAPFRLSDVMDNVAAILAVALGQKDIHLIILPPPPGVYTLMGDVLRLEQVLLNLSINAIKFTSVGQVEVSCTLLESHHDRVKLRFCVRDSGIGIAPELQRGVFEAFTQADSSTTRRFGGSGLGLTICRQLVELMGGEIGMSSEPALGSQFWFTLPLNKVADSAIARTEQLQLEAWIVDDSDIALAYASMVATGLGWQVRTFDSSESVLTHLLARQDVKTPDVVVIDWKMPGLDGLAAVRLIRAQMPPEKCPLLIMVTHHSLASLVQSEDVAQLDALIEKPLTASNLHHAVLEARRKRSSTAGLPLATPNKVLLGIRVLVVDDSEINCEVARRILLEHGAQVSLATNGQEALDWLQASPQAVDLVLMDVQMPVMDGMEATRLLRLQPEFADLPIVALTAGASRSQQLAAQAAGMTHFVSKPFDVPSTLALIVRLVRQAAPASQFEPLAAPDWPPKPAPTQAVLDLAAGLEIWDDRASYLTFLNKFIDQYRHTVAQINTSLAADDRAGAIALAHKLAGVAANLALPDTHLLASEAERVLASLADPAPTLVALDLALARAAAAVGQLATSAESCLVV